MGYKAEATRNPPVLHPTLAHTCLRKAIYHLVAKLFEPLYFAFCFAGVDFYSGSAKYSDLVTRSNATCAGRAGPCVY